MKIKVFLLSLFLAINCEAKIPSNQDDICLMLDENPRWKKPLVTTYEKWGAEPGTVMAIIRQESSFNPNAKPDREKVLGFIPWKRKSSARGYSQAIEATWEEYKKETGSRWARRSNFSNSVDFIGWYLSKAPGAGVRRYEADKLYLGYHEGWGGYKRRTYKNKDWLLDVARKVKFNSIRYKRQLTNCPIEKPNRWWNPFD